MVGTLHTGVAPLQEAAEQTINDDKAAIAQPADTSISSQASVSAAPDQLQSALSTVDSFQAVQQSAPVTEAAHESAVSRTLHISLGSLPHSQSSCTAFYFIRSQSGKLALADMDSLDCGLLAEGPSLQMLHQVHTSNSCQTLPLRSSCSEVVLLIGFSQSTNICNRGWT